MVVQCSVIALQTPLALDRNTRIQAESAQARIKSAHSRPCLDAMRLRRRRRPSCRQMKNLVFMTHFLHMLNDDLKPLDDYRVAAVSYYYSVSVLQMARTFCSNSFFVAFIIM